MNISYQTLENDITLVRLDGRLDARASVAVREALAKLLDEQHLKIVVDLEKVPFIDSSGLAALVSGLKTLGGEATNLKLAAPQSQARLLFELTMFDRVFEIHDSVEDAQNSLNDG